MADTDSQLKKLGDWILEALKFAVAVVIFLFLDKIIKKPDGLPGEILVTALVAFGSSILGYAFLQIFTGRSSISIVWVLDQYQIPNERPQIDLASNPDRGMCLEIRYTRGGLLGRYAAMRAPNAKLLLSIQLAPNGRLNYTGQTVFPGTTIGPDGVTFDLSEKLHSTTGVVVDGCEFSVSAVNPSQLALQLECVVSIANVHGKRWPTHRIFKVDSNVVGFTVRSM